MSSLFAEDQKKAFSDILALLQFLHLMPADRLHSVAGFPELWQKRGIETSSECIFKTTNYTVDAGCSASAV